MGKFIHRSASRQISKCLELSPAVILRGPRQVGKSTLAKEFAKTSAKPCVYFDLENPKDLKKFAADPIAVLEQHRNELVILDEIQNLPDILKPLRSMIDQRRYAGDKNGHYLFLGSASDNQLRQSQSLAGRVLGVNLRGLNLLEVGGRKNLARLMRRGGFPESYLAHTDFDSQFCLEGYFASIINNDLQKLGLAATPVKLLTFLELIAQHPGRIIKKKIGGQLGTNGVTVQNYLNKLADLLLITSLPAYNKNVEKKVVAMPKYYLNDVGLAQIICASIDEAGTQFDDDTIKGLRWESFVIDNLLSMLPFQWRPFFFRSHDGKMEIDLVLRRPGRKIWAIEIKQSFTYPKNTLIEACKYLNAERTFIVHKDDRPKELVEVAGQPVEILPLDEMMAEIDRHDRLSPNYQPKTD